MKNYLPTLAIICCVILTSCSKKINIYEFNPQIYLDSIRICEDRLNQQLNDSDYFETVYSLGHCFNQIGKFKQAREILIEASKKLDEMPSDEFRIKILTEKANAQANLGQYQSAAYCMGRIISLNTIINNDSIVNDSLFLKYYFKCVEYGTHVCDKEFVKSVLPLSDWDWFEKFSWQSSSIDLCQEITKIKLFYGWTYLDDPFGSELKSIADSKGKKSIEYGNLLEKKADYALWDWGYIPAPDDYYRIILLEEVLDIYREICGEKSLEYVRSAQKLSLAYSKFGDISKSMELAKYVVSQNLEWFGENNILYANALENLAECEINCEIYHDAIPLLEQALKINESEYDKGVKYADILTKLAEVYYYIGATDNAIQLTKDALSIMSGLYDSNNIPIAKAKKQLCKYYIATSQFNNIIEEFGAYDMDGIYIYHLFETLLSNGYYQEIFKNLSVSFLAKGDLINAQRYALLATDTKTDWTNILLGADDEPRYWVLNWRSADKCDDAYMALVNYYIGIGDYEKAIAELQAVLKNQQTTDEEFFVNKEQYLNLHYNLAYCLYKDNQKEEAFDKISWYYDKMTNKIVNNVPHITSDKRVLLWKKLSNGFTTIIPQIAYSSHSTNAPEFMYNLSLFSKGMMLNTNTSMQKIISESGNVDLQTLYQEYLSHKMILEHYSTNSKYDILSVKEAIQEEERLLLEQCNEYGDLEAGLKVNWQQVQSVLEANDVAIEFISFPIVDNKMTYFALLLKKDAKQPVLVKLFDENQLKTIDPNNYYVTDEIFQLVWQPLQKELNGVKRVFFSPTGLFHSIAIEYAPINNKTNIGDICNLYRLSSTRELVLHKPQNKKSLSAVLYGGLYYDAEITNSSTNVSFTANRSNTDSIHLRGGINFLEGTAIEVEEINSILYSQNYNCTLYTAEEGKEETFKNLSGKDINILHVATHGFYWEDSKSLNISFITQSNNDAVHTDNSLERSGLLLTGAANVFRHKSIPNNAEDGVLTAQEISNLDLQHVDMVVLSACQSGLGDIKDDEVFGLQRGFKMAGAKSLVMSLWKVNDEATLILMTEFYANMSHGQSAHLALSNAQQTIKTINDGMFSDPIYWAAFVILDSF